MKNLTDLILSFGDNIFIIIVNLCSTLLPVIYTVSYNDLTATCLFTIAERFGQPLNSDQIKNKFL